MFSPFPFFISLEVQKKDKHLQLFVLLASGLAPLFSEGKQGTDLYGSIPFPEVVALVLLLSAMIWFSLVEVQMMLPSPYTGDEFSAKLFRLNISVSFSLLLKKKMRCSDVVMNKTVFFNSDLQLSSLLYGTERGFCS